MKFKCDKCGNIVDKCNIKCIRCGNLINCYNIIKGKEEKSKLNKEVQK